MPPVRFVHTADWQLGLRVNFIPGDAGAVVRNERLATLRRIGAVARETASEFVVVAGDVFEHHGLRPETVRRSFDAMRDIGVPVYLLPGNHDPYTPDSLYCGGLWKVECPPNVHVLGDREPVVVREGVVLLPCPLLERHTLGDATEHVTAEYGPRDHVRIGVAHGGILEILQGMAGPDEPLHNAIPKDCATRGQLDYLALGDWHGMLRIDERTWYPGTPEATRFKERDPGKVLVVEIDAPRATPRVTQHEVAGFDWIQEEAALNEAADIDYLHQRLEALPRKDGTLVELILTGALDAKLRARLESDVLDKARDRFRFVRVRDEKLHAFLAADDLASLPGEGWLKEAVARLQTEVDGSSAEERARALALLFRLHKEAP